MYSTHSTHILPSAHFAPFCTWPISVKKEVLSSSSLSLGLLYSVDLRGEVSRGGVSRGEVSRGSEQGGSEQWGSEQGGSEQGSRGLEMT